MQIMVNGAVKHFDVGQLTVAQLLSELRFTGKRIAVECNGEIVPKSQYAQAMVQDGDTLEVVGAVGGG
ncbi:MAG: sulfur carrier protein ThiS [Methylophilaceae bacterium]|nr:MAG: sulfur carrier protein ThiS [Methylophilaceae bacterium]